MNWKFWEKKKEEKAGRILRVPRDRVEHICSLLDDYEKAVQANAKAKYILWDEIESIFPEVGYGRWKLLNNSATEMTVVEIL